MGRAPLGDSSGEIVSIPPSLIADTRVNEHM